MFAISYRNPDASMSGITMDDYATNGMRAALDAVSEITGSEPADILAVCLGGALATMTAARLAVSGKDRIGTLTLLNTLLDYPGPGQLGRFVHEGTIVKLERRMASKGYFDGVDMGGAFCARATWKTSSRTEPWCSVASGSTGAVTQDTYVVAAERDHIVPWRSSYQTTGLRGGNTRFMLVGGGHIARIVSPPEPRHG